MSAFMKRKGVNVSWHTYLITGLSHMALGLFASLIIGLIMQTIGEQLQRFFFEEAGVLFEEAGTLAMSLVGPAIGVAVAYGLKAPRLVLFSAVVSGAAGAELGGPAGSFIAAVISTELGKLI